MAILITGANREMGRTLLEEALKRGAARVYAGHRQPIVSWGQDDQVVPVRLDVTDAEQIAAAADRIGWLDILVNNAVGARVRTDATHVVACVRGLNRLEFVTATMRAALEGLAVCGCDRPSTGSQGTSAVIAACCRCRSNARAPSQSRRRRQGVIDARGLHYRLFNTSVRCEP